VGDHLVRLVRQYDRAGELLRELEITRDPGAVFTFTFEARRCPELTR
jgi:hypothetical protein